MFFTLNVVLKLPFFFESLAARLTRILVNDDLLVDTVFLIFLYLFCELLPVLTQSFHLKKPFFLFGFLKFLLLLPFNKKVFLQKMEHAGVFRFDLRNQLVQFFVKLFSFFVSLLLVVSLD